MAKRAVFWVYFAVVHIVAVGAMVVALRGAGAGPFRMETMWTESKGGSATVYFRDQLVASVGVKSDQVATVSAYAPGDLGELRFERGVGGAMWETSYWRYAPGGFHGRDIGNFVFACRDGDGDGVMERYVQKEPAVVKVLKADAWEERK